MIVEAAIFLPIIILAYFGFIVTALYVTQRVVLDSAVSRASLEASAYLTDEPKIGQKNSFSEQTEKFYVDPYRRLVKSFKTTYGTMSKTEFEQAVKKKVEKYSKLSLIGGRSGVGSLKVNVEYKYYFFFGELNIDAQQSFRLPINMAAFGVGELFTFKSSAKTMVFKPASLINDVDFIFDFLRRVGLDIRKVSNFISGLPEKLKGVFG
jgi:hypothetical protein